VSRGTEISGGFVSRFDCPACPASIVATGERLRILWGSMGRGGLETCWCRPPYTYPVIKEAVSLGRVYLLLFFILTLKYDLRDSLRVRVIKKRETLAIEAMGSCVLRLTCAALP
jgi:hypothetical protein